MTVEVLADTVAVVAVAVDPVPASDPRCPVRLPSPTLQPHIVVLTAADQPAGVVDDVAAAAAALGTLGLRGARAGRA